MSLSRKKHNPRNGTVIRFGIMETQRSDDGHENDDLHDLDDFDDLDDNDDAADGIKDVDDA